jgi:RNA-binding protein
MYPVVMDVQELRKEAHDLDVTLWVGKGGIEPVQAELNDQLAERNLVKATFLRSARGRDSVADLADDLAEATGAEVIETRGNTAVFYR